MVISKNRPAAGDVERGRRKRGEHIFRRHGNAGIDQYRGQFGQGERRGQNLPNAAHRARFGSRHTGTSAPVTLAASRTGSSLRERPFARASRRSAAAASDEPPPSPAATGNCFSRRNRPSLNPSTALGQRARRFEHEIVAARARRLRGRTGHIQFERVAGNEYQPVADSGEHHETFDLVVAIGPAPEHMQREIDFGGSELRQIA